MAGDDLSDDYVAEMLKSDAKTSSNRYLSMGLQAFLPRRCVSLLCNQATVSNCLLSSTTNAPKPNTRFLRNIIRETDNHNAALLAKEASESKARLKDMYERPDRAKSDRYGHPSREDESREDETGERQPKRRRVAEVDEDGEERHHRQHRFSKAGNVSLKGQRERSNGKRSGHEDLSKEEFRSNRRHSKSRRHTHGSASPVDDSHRKGSKKRRHRRRSHSPSRSRSRSPRESTSRRSQQRHHSSRTSRSLTPDGRRKHTATNRKHVPLKLRSASPMSDSDPLEAIVGPVPPPPPSKVQPRGRGTFSGLAMDSRFSASYDPSTDVRPDSDLDDDDWDQALAALRDRQRWKEQGAERLKAAGFSETEVKSWEKGGEKTEEDVRWAKKGEGREWDRGKVVGDEGDVELKDEWGRLKGT